MNLSELFSKKAIDKKHLLQRCMLISCSGFNCRITRNAIFKKCPKCKNFFCKKKCFDQSSSWCCKCTEIITASGSEKKKSIINKSRFNITGTHLKF